MAKYFIWTFLFAWLLQTGTVILYQTGNPLIGQLLMVVMMFAPMLGVILSGTSLKGMGWKIHIKKNVFSFLTAWFLPALLTAAGAAIYFLIFPQHFDLTGNYLAATVGEDAFRQLEEQGLTYPLYVFIMSITSLTYAPILNMLAAVGEETGWRGFLYPRLKEKFGKKRGLLIGGIIWGIWHWPLIWLIGYDYGTDYIGFPITGMIIFCLFTISCGILCDWLYEKSGSIWIPSLLHGAVNATINIPLMLCFTENPSMRLLGPQPLGLLAGLPLMVVAAIVLFRSKKQKLFKKY